MATTTAPAKHTGTSRLSDDELLALSLLDSVPDSITTAAQIAEMMGKPLNNVRQSLDRLERRFLVTSHRLGLAIYYTPTSLGTIKLRQALHKPPGQSAPAKQSAPQDRSRGALTPTQLRILRALAALTEFQSPSRTEIANAARYSARHTQRHLLEMEQQGLVRSWREGHRRIFALTELAQKLLTAVPENILPQDFFPTNRMRMLVPLTVEQIELLSAVSTISNTHGVKIQDIIPALQMLVKLRPGNHNKE